MRRIWTVVDWTGAMVLRIVLVVVVFWLLVVLGTHGFSLANCWTTGCI